MELSIEDIASNYARMTDETFIRIATQDAKGLRPEIFAVIESEIHKRGLSLEILEGVKGQNKDYTKSEIEAYAQLLRGLRCPICKNNSQSLNGTFSYTVRSFLIFTTFSSGIFVACPNCLDGINNSAMFTTALMGWWSFPRGFFRTPVYIYRNIRAKKDNWLEEPNAALLSFTLNNIGQIITYKDHRKKLQEIIGPET